MSRRAHTLTELLVVLTILALFAGIVLPRFAAATVRRRLAAGIERMRDDLQYARQRAVASGLRHQFELDRETGAIVVTPYRPEQAVNPQAAQDGQAAAPALQDQLHEDISIAEWTVYPLGLGQQQAASGQDEQNRALVFYPEGRSDAGRVVIQTADGERAGLVVDGLTGEIRDMTPDEIGR